MKKTLTTITLAIVLFLGSTFANAGTGIIIAGVPAEDAGEPCTESSNDGIIIAGLHGIIIAGFSGIIIAGLVDDDSTQTCGIIIAG